LPSLSVLDRSTCTQPASQPEMCGGRASMACCFQRQAVLQRPGIALAQAAGLPPVRSCCRQAGSCPPPRYLRRRRLALCHLSPRVAIQPQRLAHLQAGGGASAASAGRWRGCGFQHTAALAAR
jgi:hypothetical protein